MYCQHILMLTVTLCAVHMLIMLTGPLVMSDGLRGSVGDLM